MIFMKLYILRINLFFKICWILLFFEFKEIFEWNFRFSGYYVECTEVMGFCFFNNIVIVVKYV